MPECRDAGCLDRTEQRKKKTGSPGKKTGSTKIRTGKRLERDKNILKTNLGLIRRKKKKKETLSPATYIGKKMET
jgi:hypothetical protein